MASTFVLFAATACLKDRIDEQERGQRGVSIEQQKLRDFSSTDDWTDPTQTISLFSDAAFRDIGYLAGFLFSFMCFWKLFLTEKMKAENFQMIMSKIFHFNKLTKGIFRQDKT